MFVLWIMGLGADIRAFGRPDESGKVTVHAVTTFGVAISEMASLELKEIGSGILYQGKGTPPPWLSRMAFTNCSCEF